MVQTQTFGILREPRAPAARRLTPTRAAIAFPIGRRAQRVPAKRPGSYGLPGKAGAMHGREPRRPKGIMQISEATAHDMGLAVKHATLYRKVKERVAAPPSAASRNSNRNPQDSLFGHRTGRPPGSAAPFPPPPPTWPAWSAGSAAATGYLRLPLRPGLRCANARSHAPRQRRTQRAGHRRAHVFFVQPGVESRALRSHPAGMQRDWSPTYWFRVRRAEQLLALYREDPAAFASLAREYQSDFTSARPPHRLSVWLRRPDLVFHSDDICAPASPASRWPRRSTAPAISATLSTCWPIRAPTSASIRQPRRRPSARSLPSRSRRAACGRRWIPRARSFTRFRLSRWLSRRNSRAG